MTIKVIFHGGLRTQLAKPDRRPHAVYASTFWEVRSWADQLLPFSAYMRDNSIEVRVGPTLRESRSLTAWEAARMNLRQGSTLHIAPHADGNEITTAMLVTALVTTAIGIGVSLLANILFPPPTTKDDSRKSALYNNGLQNSKEGIPLPYLAGDTVFCGGNVIEGDYDYTNSGGSAAPTSIFFGNTPTYVNGSWSTPADAETLEADGGSKKGGGKSISNTTYSDATIRFAQVIGAGEIGGIIGSDGPSKSKNIFINEVALVDPGTGAPNWPGIQWEERLGVEGQAALKLTPGTTSPFKESTDPKHADGQSGAQAYLPRTVTAGDVNRVKLDFRINSLVHVTKKGNEEKTNVAFAADVKRATGTTWINAGNWSLNEKSSAAFDRQYQIAAPPPIAGDDEAWLFRVYRTTPDSTDDKTQNSTTFEGWVEITDKAYLYDGTEAVGNVPCALFAAAIDLASFDMDSKPEVALLVQGQKVRVPSNYDGLARTTSGNWDGSWKYAVTANPVWHWMETATSKTMGCGYPDSFIDKFSLYQTAARCDQQINGRFRYTLNKQFTDEVDGWQNLINVAQTFRAYPYFNGSQILLWQDRPGTPDHVINNSAVLEGRFNYEGIEGAQQFNECVVQYDNPDDYYRVANVKYQDTDSITANRAKGISNNGIISTTVYKTGCTNLQEAHDFAKAIVFDAQNQNFTISFTTSINACAYAPGQRILVDDWRISGKEITGRVTSVGSGTLTIDNTITQKANTSYDALMVINNALARRPITQVQATTTTATFAVDVTGLEAWTPISIVENSANAAQPLEYSITKITETSTGQFTVSALRYIEGKHDYLDFGTPVTATTFSQIQVITPRPQNIKFSPYSYMDDILGARHGIDVSWDPVVATATGTGQGLALAGYSLEVERPNSSTWKQEYKGTSNYTNVLNCDPGLYSFSLRSINALGRTSPALTMTFNYTSDNSSGIEPPVFDGFK